MSTAKRIIRGAEYRYSWVFLNSNNNQIVSAPTNVVVNINKDFNGFAVAAGNKGSLGLGVQYIDFSSTDMAADYIDIIATSDSTTVNHYGSLQADPALHSGIATGGGAASISLAAAASTDDGLYNGALIEIVRGTGAGQVRAIVDYTGGSRISNVDRNWAQNPDSTSVYVIHGTGIPMSQDSAALRVHSDVLQVNSSAAAATNLGSLYTGAFENSSINQIDPSSTEFIADGTGLSSTDDQYNSMLLVFTSGANQGVPRKIIDYKGTTYEFTVEAFPSAPANGDTFIVIALIA